MTQIYIENSGLLIHNLESCDLNALTALREDKRVYEYEPSFLAELQGSPEEAMTAIQGMDLHIDRQRILGVYEKSNPDTLVGLAEYYDYKTSGKVISIGYRFRSAFWSMGFGTRCVHALLDYIQSNTEVELVTAHVMPANEASSRILQKNGFKYLLTKTEDWGHDKLTTADVYTFDC